MQVLTAAESAIRNNDFSQYNSSKIKESWNEIAGTDDLDDSYGYVKPGRDAPCF